MNIYNSLYASTLYVNFLRHALLLFLMTLVIKHGIQYTSIYKYKCKVGYDMITLQKLLSLL